MIYFINIVFLYILSLFTLSTFNSLRIFSTAPLIPLFFIINLSYYRKGFEPILLAAFAGIYFDLYSSYPFGLYLFLFLASAVIVRYMFQEGMRSFSFIYFLIISGLSLVFYYGAQLVFLYIDKIKITFSAIPAVAIGIGVNLAFAVLVYLVSIWYFDKLETLEQRLKRR